MNFGEINLIQIMINEQKLANEIIGFLRPIDLSCLS
jgi:hypothetical protein